MEILSEIPGRIRVHYQDLTMTSDICRQMETTLAARPGITYVRPEPRISTLLVKYDTTVLTFDRVIQILSTFSLYDDGETLSTEYYRQERSLHRAVQRSIISGCLLAGSYAFHFLNAPSRMLDAFATVYTGYTVLSHGDREHGRLHHPDIITGFITSLTLGPSKMTEVALTSWVMNIFELREDYHRLMAHHRHLISTASIALPAQVG